MEELSINILVEAKNEYTKQLTNILVPYIYEGFESIYSDAVDLDRKNSLKTFQTLLFKVPKWNQEMIDTEAERIINASKCSYLGDLLTAVFVANAKILTAVSSINRGKKINLKVPQISQFMHKCYIEGAREFYKNPYLFDRSCRTMEKHRNLREALTIVNSTIEEAVRKLLPMQDILQQYLGEAVGMHDEDISNEKHDSMKFDKKFLKYADSDRSEGGGLEIQDEADEADEADKADKADEADKADKADEADEKDKRVKVTDEQEEEKKNKDDRDEAEDNHNVQTKIVRITDVKNVEDKKDSETHTNKIDSDKEIESKTSIEKETEKDKDAEEDDVHETKANTKENVEMFSSSTTKHVSPSPDLSQLGDIDINEEELNQLESEIEEEIRRADIDRKLEEQSAESSHENIKQIVINDQDAKKLVPNNQTALASYNHYSPDDHINHLKQNRHRRIIRRKKQKQYEDAVNQLNKEVEQQMGFFNDAEDGSLSD